MATSLPYKTRDLKNESIKITYMKINKNNQKEEIELKLSEKGKIGSQLLDIFGGIKGSDYNLERHVTTFFDVDEVNGNDKMDTLTNPEILNEEQQVSYFVHQPKKQFSYELESDRNRVSMLRKKFENFEISPFVPKKSDLSESSKNYENDPFDFDGILDPKIYTLEEKIEDMKLTQKFKNYKIPEKSREKTEKSIQSKIKNLEDVHLNGNGDTAMERLSLQNRIFRVDNSASKGRQLSIVYVKDTKKPQKENKASNKKLIQNQNRLKVLKEQPLVVERVRRWPLRRSLIEYHFKTPLPKDRNNKTLKKYKVRFVLGSQGEFDDLSNSKAIFYVKEDEDVDLQRQNSIPAVTSFSYQKYSFLNQNKDDPVIQIYKNRLEMRPRRVL